MLIAAIANRDQTSFLAKEVFTPDAPTWRSRLWVLDDAGQMAASNVVTVTTPCVVRRVATGRCVQRPGRGAPLTPRSYFARR